MRYAHIVFRYALIVNRYALTIYKNSAAPASIGEGVEMSERRYRHPQVNLRLPDELKEQIAELATKHGRSMNAEMVEAISFYIQVSKDVESDPAVLERESVTMRKEDIKELITKVKNSVIESLLSQYELTPKADSKKPT